MDHDQTPQAPTLLDEDRIKIIIPECCREGWDDCPHVVNREKKPKRQNPGL